MFCLKQLGWRETHIDITVFFLQLAMCNDLLVLKNVSTFRKKQQLNQVIGEQPQVNMPYCSKAKMLNFITLRTYLGCLPFYNLQ